MNSNEIVKKYGEKKIIIFGAGNDGTRFYKSNIHRLDIVYFIDNGDIQGHSVYGKALRDFLYLKEKYTDEIIVVTSCKYCTEMVKQLEENGFEKNKNYCVWDGDKDTISVDFGDENVKSLIKLNEKLWGGKDKKRKKNKILIPYRNSAEIVYSPWSYCANYLADKYDAEIICTGGERDKKNEELYKLYESFNVVDYIDETPDEEAGEEINCIFNKLWDSVRTIEDIKGIEIYGEKYGIDFLRDYFRMEFPQLYMDDYSLKKQIKRMVGYVVFWSKYFKENADTIKAVIVWDGLYYREGIIRKIAFGYGIPVYTVVNTTCHKWERDVVYNFEFYKKFYFMLDDEEKKKGMSWAKEKLEKHISGYTDDEQIHKLTFGVLSQVSILEKNSKVKVMICPHYMEDDAYPYGDMLFDDQWDWLHYLGEMSEKLDYDWYLKPHPIEKTLGDALIAEYLKKYKNIKLLPKYVSPIQLKEEGMNYALTIHGSIGYEYPYIGINVINAGYNPYIAFDFDINPKSLGEYKKIISDLPLINKKVEKEEILQFYCIHYGYYIPRERWMNKIFFNNEILQEVRGLVGSKTERTTELFRIYVDEITEERHKELLDLYSRLFDEMDKYKDGVFYKKELP